MKLILILAVTTFTFAVAAENSSGDNMAVEHSQSNESADPEVILKRMSWLVGRWQGEAFGGRCEEIWSPSSAGRNSIFRDTRPSSTFRAR